MKKKIIELNLQTDIDTLEWQKIKSCGIDGAMIPLGDADYYGRVTVNNFAAGCISAAAEAGLEAGVILNIRCKDPFSAHEAAYNAVEVIKRYKDKLLLGIAYGFFEKKRSCLIEQGKDGLTDTALALLFETERLGYDGIIYTNFDFADTYLDIGRINGRRFWGEQNIKWDKKLIIKKITGEDILFVGEFEGLCQNVMDEKD